MVVLTLPLQFSPPLQLPPGVFLSYTNFSSGGRQDINLGGEVRRIESPASVGLRSREHLKPFPIEQRLGILRKFWKMVKMPFHQNESCSQTGQLFHHISLPEHFVGYVKSGSYPTVPFQHFPKEPFSSSSPMWFYFCFKIMINLH